MRSVLGVKIFVLLLFTFVSQITCGNFVVYFFTCVLDSSNCTEEIPDLNPGTHYFNVTTTAAFKIKSQQGRTFQVSAF